MLLTAIDVRSAKCVATLVLGTTRSAVCVPSGATPVFDDTVQSVFTHAALDQSSLCVMRFDLGSSISRPNDSRVIGS